MKNVLVAVVVGFVSVLNVAAQWTAPSTASGTTPIHYDGNVGVGTGTTSPGYKLDINGQIGLSGRVGGRQSQIEFGNSSTIDWLGFPNVNQTYYVSARPDEIQFRVDTETGAFRFKIPTKELFYAQANTGRVGIGTISPEAKLTLGAISPGLTSAATIFNARSASIGNLAGSYVYPFELQTQTSGSLERLQIASYRRVAGTDWQGTGWRIQSAVDNSFTDGSSAFIELGATDPSVSGGGFIAIGTGGQERLSIASGGNVGIGASPTSANLLEVGGNAHFNGTLMGNNIQAQYQDVAEWVATGKPVKPGMVVVVATTATNTVIPSIHPYDTRVAGVVSAHPGLILGTESPTKAQIATTGRVKVRVDATRHAVAIGDLLVTSDTPGMAMTSEPLDLGGVKIHRPGTLIGKALEPLANGQGEILVLLSLQ
jgi:hypothetical protein